MDLRIARRCPMRWEDLRGDDRVRYCDRCRLDVYNFAAMDTEEQNRLVAQAKGRLCGRLVVRQDGRAMFGECGHERNWRWLRRTFIAAGMLAGMLSLPRFLAQLARRGNLPTPVVRVLEKMGVVDAPPFTLGLVAPSPPPTPPSAPQ